MHMMWGFSNATFWSGSTHYVRLLTMEKQGTMIKNATFWPDSTYDVRLLIMERQATMIKCHILTGSTHDVRLLIMENREPWSNAIFWSGSKQDVRLLIMEKQATLVKCHILIWFNTWCEASNHGETGNRDQMPHSDLVQHMMWGF